MTISGKIQLFDSWGKMKKWNQIAKLLKSQKPVKKIRKARGKRVTSTVLLKMRRENPY